MRLKKIAALIVATVMTLSAFAVVSVAQAEKTDKTLQFGDDGKFTVLHVTDIQDRHYMSTVAKKFLADTLDEVKPDLVVLGGDNIAGNCIHTTANVEKAIDQFMSIFEAKGVKVAAVFGNHDAENKCSTKASQIAMYEKYDCYVGCAGYTAENRTGNYSLPVLSSDGSRTAFNFWLIDSGEYNDENDLGGYGCVTKSQIEWYKEQSMALADANGGKPVPAIAFQHIVVPEIYDVLTEVDKDTEGAVERWLENDEKKYYVLPEGAKGELLEVPCPPNYSNGEFDAMLEMGDVLAIAFGHDHRNTFEIEHKGIDLINTPGLSFSTSSYNGGNMGMRTFVIDENDPASFETEIVDYYDIYSRDDELMVSGFEMCNQNNSVFVRIRWFIIHYMNKLSDKLGKFVINGSC